MSKVNVRKYIKTLDNNSLQQIILDLYTLSKEAKEYLEYAISPDDHSKFIEIKSLIDREFCYTQKYRRLKFTKCKNAIANFKKLDPANEYVAELMIYMVESASSRASQWGNAEPSFIYSLASNYTSAAKFILKYNLQDFYKDRLKILVREIDRFGYGVGFGIDDIYSEIYGKSAFD